MGVRRLEYVYGFHGCDKSVAQGVLEKKSVMLSSDNDYDWLGSGIYFWEEAPARAYEWAKWKFKKNAAVIGAKIRLGQCLNLLDVAAYKPLRDTFEVLKASGRTLPTNTKYPSEIAPRSSSCSPLTFPKSPKARAAIPDDPATSAFWV